MKPAIARFLPLLLLGTALTGCAGVDYSPDGTKLAFTWILSEKKALAVINVDGTEFKYVSSIDVHRPKWAPDNRRIACGNEDGMSVLDTVTGRASLVVPKSAKDAVWSEDGRKLATLAPGQGGPETSEVVWYDFEAKAVTLRSPVNGLTSPYDATQLVWVPRTSGLAFIGRVGDATDVFLMESGETKRVTSTGDVVGLALEPGGKKLVWARKSRNPKYILLTLYAFDLVQRSAQRLAFPERVPGINPGPRSGPDKLYSVIFSPTLEHLLIWTQTGEQGPVVGHTVNRAGTHSSVVGQITKDQATVDVAWSPDGNQMTSLLYSETSIGLETRNADGSAPRTLKKQTVK